MSNICFERDIGKLARGTGLAGFGMVVKKVSIFIILALQVRYLGIERYGAFVIALGIATLLMVPQCLGFQSGLSRFSVQARIDKNPEHLWSVFWCGLLLPFLTGLILGFVLIAISSLINNQFYKSDYVLTSMIVFGFTLPFLGPALMPAILTTSFETNRYAVISRDIVGPATEILLLASLFWLPQSITQKHGIPAVVIVRCIGQVICAIVGACFFFKLAYDKKLILRGGIISHLGVIVRHCHYVKEAVFYCLPLMMGSAFQRIVQWTDTIMIGSFLDTASAGAYRIAVQISIAVTSVLHIIGSIFGPIIARYHHMGRREMIAKLYSQATRWTLIGVFPFAIPLFIFSKQFLLIFGKEAAVAFLALQILVFGQVFNSFTGNVGIILTMAGKPYWHAINGIVVVISHIILCLTLIPNFGMVGAASSTAIVVIMLNTLRVLETKRFFGFHCISRTVMQTFIPAVAGFVALLIAQRPMEKYFGNHLLIVLFSIFVSCILVWGIHAAFCLSSEDKHFVRSIITRVLGFTIR